MVPAFVFVQVSNPTSLAGLHSTLQLITHVGQIYFLTGSIHILIQVNAPDMQALLDTVSRFRGVGGIARADLNLIMTIV